MDVDALTPGEYIKAAEFGSTLPQQPTWTIGGASIEEMASLKPGATEKTVEKGVIHFREMKRGWVMNKTNAQCMTAMFGREVSGWDGKRVTLKAEMVQVGPSKQPGIRVVGSPDIANDITFDIRLPKKKPIKVTLVKTGGGNQARTSTGSSNGGNTNTAKPLDAFLDAVVAQLKLDRERVVALAASEGLALAAMSHEDLRKVYARLSPGKDLRAKYDAPPADQDSDQDEELPPGEGRSFGDDATDDTP